MSEIPKSDRMEWWPRANVRLSPRNVRRHSPGQLADLSNAMMRFGWTIPCLVVEDKGKSRCGEIVAGHGRYEAAPGAGFHDEVKVLVAEGWSPEMIAQYRLLDNQIALAATWDDAALVEELTRISAEYGRGSIGGLGWDQDGLDALLNPQPPARQGVKGSLAEAFGVPPFSVLIAREGWWQNRKRLWLRMGIQSELGRADHVEGKASHKGAPKGGGRLYAGRTKGGKFSANRNYGKPK